jgi:hypothetical protein
MDKLAKARGLALEKARGLALAMHEDRQALGAYSLVARMGLCYNGALGTETLPTTN